jgi:ABC-type molybdate transport system ATPase subunit
LHNSTLPLKRKLEIFRLLRKVISEKGIPILYSTSSVSEAVRLSDKIILIDQLPSKVVSEKTIVLDIEKRVGDKMIFNMTDYFTEKEISILSNGII